jgi:hypothetical protein
MKLAAAWIAPFLSLSVASATPALASAGPLAGANLGMLAPAAGTRAPTVMGSKDERSAKAAENYEQNRPVEAALGFEGLWKDFPGELDFLFNAAASRFAAGHFAHAIAHTDEYLALKNVGAAERKAAEAQRRAAVVQTGAAAVTVRFAAPPAGAVPVEIVAQFIPRDSGDIRPDLVFAGKPGSAATLQLDPGFWTVRAQAGGHLSSEQRVEVSKGQTATVGLELAPAPKDMSPPVTETARPTRPREVPAAVVRRQQLGFGVAGGVVAAAGIGVVALGSVQMGNARKCTGEREPCAIEFSVGVMNRGAGLTVLGGGLGLIAGSLPWLAKDVGVRKKAWIAEAVIGGALTIAGAAVLGATKQSFWKDLDENPTAKAVGNVAGAVMFGLGVGTVVSAVTGLVVQRHHLRKVDVGASAGRGQFGVMLSGRF